MPETGGSIFAKGQIVTVFRSRLRSDAGAEYEAMAAEMLELGRARPGFVDFKSFTADDGERVSIVTFADDVSHRAWRDQVDHRRAQQAGRDRFYSCYSVQVAECRTTHAFQPRLRRRMTTAMTGRGSNSQLR